MFRYSFEKNIINAFFPLAVVLLRAPTIAACSVVMQQVDALEVEHSSNAKHFNDIGFTPKKNQPTAYQKSIFDCEGNFLTGLRFLHMHRLKQLNQDIDQVEYERCVQRLKDLNAHYVEDEDKLVLLLNIYLIVMTAILTLEESSSLPDSKMHNSVIFKAVNIFDYAYLFLHIQHEFTLQKIDNLTPECAIEMCQGLKLMLKDQQAKTNADQFTFLLNQELIRKLLSYRDIADKQAALLILQLPKVEPAGYLLQASLQQYRDQIIRIDALLYRLNLIEYPEYRKKYDNHISLNKIKPKLSDDSRHSSNARIPLVSGLIDARHKVEEQIKTAINLLIGYLADCEGLYSALQLLKPIPRGYDLVEIELAVIMQVRNIYFDAMLLLAHTISLGDKSDSLSIMMEDLQFVMRLSTLYLYVIDPENNVGLKYSFLNIKINLINFNRIHGDSYLRSLGMLLFVKTQVQLSEAFTQADRQVILQQCAVEVRLLIERIGLRANLADQTSVLLKQFIIDYYILCTHVCFDKRELAILTSGEIYQQVFSLQVDVNNRSAYDAIHDIVLKFKPDIYIDAEVDLAESDDGEDLIANFYITLYDLCKTKIKSLGEPEYLISPYLAAIFLKYSAESVNYISEFAEGSKQSEAQFLLKKIFHHLQVTYQDVKRNIDNTSFTFSLYSPVKFTDNKQTFMVNLPVNKLPNKNSKKKSIQPKVVRVQKVAQPDITAPFMDMMAHLGNNLIAVKIFYEKGLLNHKPQVRFFAVIGLLECLPLMEDKTKRDKLAEKLLSFSPAIFKDCIGYVNEDHRTKVSLHCDATLDIWRKSCLKPAPLKKPVVSVTKFVETKKSIEKKYKPITSSVVFITKKMAAEPKVNLSSKPALIKNGNEFLEMSRPYDLSIKFTKAQKAVIDLLHSRKLHPLVHGGAVVDSLFGIPYRDLDLLCFGEEAELIKLLDAHKTELNISAYRRNINSPVIVITFVADNTVVESEQLELAFLPAVDGARAQHLRLLARQFGINLTLYYDPFSQMIVDPLVQFQRILNERKLDVCQVLSVNMDNYFTENPDRILDCIYKVAKYKKYNVELIISDHVNDSINNHAKIMQSGLKSKFHLNKFDKLFLCGFSVNSLQLLCKRYDFITTLFPMIKSEHLPVVQQTCLSFDNWINSQEQIKITLQTLRTEFITNVFYPLFISNKNIFKYYEDEDQLYKDCNIFLREMNFYITDELVNLVQDAWWKLIAVECHPVLSSKLII
jgi:hypothetical protein